MPTDVEKSQSSTKEGNDPKKFKAIRDAIFSWENPYSWLFKAEQYSKFTTWLMQRRSRFQSSALGKSDMVDWCCWAHYQKRFKTWEDMKTRLSDCLRFKTTTEEACGRASSQSNHIRQLWNLDTDLRHIQHHYQTSLKRYGKHLKGLSGHQSSSNQLPAC